VAFMCWAALVIWIAQHSIVCYMFREPWTW